MTQSIQVPPSPLEKSRFNLLYLLLLYPVYLAASWWVLYYDINFSWSYIVEPNTLWNFGTLHIFLGCVLIAWQTLRLRKGYAKLQECSDYEGYLNNVFDTRDRNRPAQNANRLEGVRKMRGKNIAVRATAESYQFSVYLIAFFSVLILMLGCIMQFISQLLA